ncbi:MAG: hypothetical protein WB816_01895 [Methylocystis sp.]
MWRKLNELPEIGHWYSLFGNTFCLASKQSAQRLAARLREEVLPEVKFLIVEIDATKKGGWLPGEIWDFLNRPEATTLFSYARGENSQREDELSSH